MLYRPIEWVPLMLMMRSHALPPRLPKPLTKHTMPWKEPHRSCFEDERARCPLTAPRKGNMGSDDVQGCGVGWHRRHAGKAKALAGTLLRWTMAALPD